MFSNVMMVMDDNNTQIHQIVHSKYVQFIAHQVYFTKVEKISFSFKMKIFKALLK